MNKLRWLWILVALAIVLGIMLATFPARLALSALLPDTAALQLEDVSGSIWNGRAGRVLYQGEDQGRLQWRLHAGSLLLGRIQTSIDLVGNDLEAVATIGRRGEHVRIAAAHLTLPARRLDPVLDIPSLRLTGTIRIDIEELELQSRVPTALKGSATWSDAGVTGVEQASFGTLGASFGALPGGGFGGELADQGGPLALDGHFRTTILGYEAEALLRARDDNPQVTRALSHIGQVQPDGSVLFRVQGGIGR